MEELINALSWIDTIAATVWIGLTVIMFWILYKVYGKEGKKHPVFRFGVFLLILVWLYPLYTFVFNQFEVGLVGNLLTLWATYSYRKQLKPLGGNYANWMYPQLIWICLATIYVGLLLINRYQLS
ncbi:MAG: hypothetical protein KJO94_08850 [Eudoraea sp.]|nr:hypothetical protein [Eudoraea sp.]MBT8323574.1 hypothetical protein [Eudoraea sp.]NNJ38640.1 hypothetical protein [Flavobacteriaceae bacterium]